MTSEVLILNKHAVVLAADSAVTMGPAQEGDHPRYAKTATKLFELSSDGSVAVTIFGGTHIDLVPWELIIRLYRSHLGDLKFPTFDQYLDHLLSFLRGNVDLFPIPVLEKVTAARFQLAVEHTLSVAMQVAKRAFDTSLPMESRKDAWRTTAERIAHDLASEGLHASLSSAGLTAMQESTPERIRDLERELAAAPELAGVDPAQLADLAIRMLFTRPADFLGSTGIVVAGYGEQNIFPGFKSIEVYGHVGRELIAKDDKMLQVTHTNPSHLEALAQASMIDVFTDGFGLSLWQIIESESRRSLHALIANLETRGVAISPDIADVSTKSIHVDFMQRWTQENYRRNWSPLKNVLGTLSVQEMAHFAETLLTLESLKERVTASSESVGGPIDVAAITKADGLIWLKRKHLFEPNLNLRYVARLQRQLCT